MAVTGLWTLVLVAVAAWRVEAAPPAHEADCFRMYPHKKLATDREKIFLSVTVEECQEKCLHLHQSAFLCLSFDYIAEENVCKVSPESSYTAPSMLQTSQKTDHYERMLDCVHFHVPDTPGKFVQPDLKTIGTPKQEETVRMHLDEGGVGSLEGSLMVNVKKQQPQHMPSADRAITQAEPTLTQDMKKNTSRSNSSDIIVFILALQSYRKEGNGMRARHQKVVHTMVQELPRHHERPLHSASEIHNRASHIGEDWPRSGILERYIRGLQHERAQDVHISSHVDPHSSQDLLLRHPKQQHDHDSQKSLEARESAHGGHRTSHVKMSHDETPPLPRHMNHLSARELHTDRPTAKSVHQEVKMHKAHDSKNSEKYKNREKKHVSEMKQDDLNYKKYQGRKEQHNLLGNDLKATQNDERIKKHGSGRHVKDLHGFDANGEPKDINENHLTSAEQEDLQRVIQEEKIRNKHHSVYAKGTHIWNEHHLQAAEEEDLRRVVHDEHLHNQQMDPESWKVRQRRKEHPASHDDTLDKAQGKRHGPKATHASHDRRQRSAHEEADTAHEDELRDVQFKSGHKPGVKEKHSDQADHERIPKRGHDLKYHSQGADVHDDAEPVMKQQRRSQLKTAVHASHHDTSERTTDPKNKKNKHRGCSSESSENMFDEKTMHAAEREEVMRIQHDEAHHHEARRQKVAKKRSPHRDHSLNEEHLQRARAEDLVRFKHDEMHGEEHPRNVLAEKHLDSAHQEELMRIEGEEKHRTLPSHRGKEVHMGLPFNEQHFERASHEELARIRHDEHEHARKYERQARKTEKHGAHPDKRDRTVKHAAKEVHSQGLRQDHLDHAHKEELARMRVDENLLSEEERQLREDAMEEESGSGSASGSEPIGSGEGVEDEGSGSGNWHWGPREVFVEDDRAARTKQLVEDSDVWDTHAD